MTGNRTVRRSLAAILMTLAVALALAPTASKATDPKSDMMKELLNNLAVLNEAVLDWCDTQGGQFALPNVSSPGCKIGKGIWAGTFGLINYEPGWWWNKRAETEDPYYKFGLLWLVLPIDSDAPCAAALAALNNPARIPVKLIGPRAHECQQ
ncbi:MAG: hypothetical protein F4X83_07330 [Chloroflexi bacterium]|nr:hypothetical protein [Chloroflexota bacterium]